MLYFLSDHKRPENRVIIYSIGQPDNYQLLKPRSYKKVK